MKHTSWLRYWMRRSQAVEGFTLLELLVVILIVGILAAIAAPTWEKQLGRQRVSTAREQLAQTLRQAQNQARRSRTPQVVYLDTNDDTPRFATSNFSNTNTPAYASIQSWQKVGNADIPKGSLQMDVFVNQAGTVKKVTAADSRIIFDANGVIDQRSNVTFDVASNKPPFAIVLKGSKTGPGEARCIIIQTRLGSIYTAEGTGTNKCPN